MLWQVSSNYLTANLKTPNTPGQRAFQLSGNGPVGQPLLFQRLNDPSFFSLKVLPAFAFRQFCVIMMAVHSDRPLDECCLQTPFYHAGISLWIFSLSVQLHFTINQRNVC